MKIKMKEPQVIVISKLKKEANKKHTVIIFQKITTFFNLEDMFRCYEHHRQLHNVWKNRWTI